MSVLLYLLPLGFIFDLVGYLPPSGRLLLIYGLLALPLALKPSRQAAWLALGLGVVVVVRALLPWPAVAETALLLLAHQVIWAVIAPVPRALRMGVVAYAVLHLWLFVSPLGLPVLEYLTTSGNQLAQRIAGQPIHFGPSYLNVGGLLLFLMLSVFGWDRTQEGPLRTAVFLVATSVLNALAAVLLLKNADFAASFSWTLKFRDAFGFPELWKNLKGMAVIVYPGMVFLMQFVVYVLTHYGRAAMVRTNGGSEFKFHLALHFGTAADLTDRPRTGGGPVPVKQERAFDKRRLVLAAVAGLTVLVVVPPTSWRRPAPCDLVFVERGVVSFTKPDYTRYGESAGGMFGMLPEYARLFGCKAVVVKDVPATLDPEQVLVFTNLDEDLGKETYQRVWEFVAKGGSLWVLGDHTFIKNGRNHLNELLEPTHISFNNDSAQFFPQGWFNSYRFMQGTPFATLRDDAENRPGILVGASLELGVPAQPFVIGRFAYADRGLDKPSPEANRGYLGDFKYQSGKVPRELKPDDPPSERLGERLGDLTLVAGERYGKGRVLVYGDTSSFFNNNLTRSFELLRSSLAWLGESNKWTVSASTWGRRLAVLLVVGFGCLAFWWRSAPVETGALAVSVEPEGLGQNARTTGGASILPAAILRLGNPLIAVFGQLGAAPLLAITAISFVTHGQGGLPGYDEPFAQEHLAILDYSHQPNASKHSAMDSGLHGVGINLLRHGELPIAMNDWDPALLGHAKYLVLNAPRRPITGGEYRDLKRFMERGGTVILGCGYLDAAGCKNLLEPLGCEIGAVPLGRFFDRPAFGQPVSFMCAWALAKVPKEAKILCASADWPLMVEVPVGKGSLVLIGDSEFLHNRNVEGHKNHDPANTAFLKNLFDSTTR